jgi:putative ABC transport system permease protein
MTITLPRTKNTTSTRSRAIDISEILSMAIEALWSNKIRTLLTMLGVIIGIASVIAITAVGLGVQQATQQQIQSLGSNVIQIFPSAAKTGGISQGLGSSTTLTWEDAEAIEKYVPGAEKVSAYLQRPGQVVSGQDNHSTNIVGIDLDYMSTRNTKLTHGRFFTEEEMTNSSPVAILGSTVFEELFDNSEAALGSQLRIQGNKYEIIGVFEPKGSEGSIDRDDQVFIPLSNMSSRVVGNNSLNGVSVNGIYVKAKSQAEITTTQTQTTNLLRQRHNLSASQSDDFSLRTQTDVVNTFSNVVGLFTVMVAAIAGISLVVGGIGIANIMLVSVIERTREIGIRKAVGATNSAILQQFLAESILISLVGGFIGMVTGIVIAFLAATILNFPLVISVWSVVSGFVLSLIVGLLAGVIPARNAAQLDPITALRSE